MIIAEDRENMSKFYFGSNLKMYKTIEETKNYLIELQKLTDI